jgi:hypothetical protein
VVLSTDQRSADHWFNTAAFKSAPTAALGTAGVGTIVGPGLYLWDVALRKVFAIHESWNLRFTADSFNVMNHANFRSLSVTTSSADFGALDGSGPARNIQFGLRLTF